MSAKAVVICHHNNFIAYDIAIRRALYYCVSLSGEFEPDGYMRIREALLNRGFEIVPLEQAQKRDQLRLLKYIADINYLTDNNHGEHL